MRLGIFDIETTGLYADDGIVLCMSHKLYMAPPETLKTIRADAFPSWKKQKTDNKAVVVTIMEALRDYDILVAHNGQFFDKAWLTTACLKYGLDPFIAFKKTIDPCQIARRKLRLHRNTLQALQAYLGIPVEKTPVAFEHWLRAGLDGDQESMAYIVEHCEKDVLVLEAVYDALRKVVKQIDDGGSAR